jgi:hypothetical protein
MVLYKVCRECKDVFFDSTKTEWDQAVHQCPFENHVQSVFKALLDI